MEEIDQRRQSVLEKYCNTFGKFVLRNTHRMKKKKITKTSTFDGVRRLNRIKTELVNATFKKSFPDFDICSFLGGNLSIS